jgi:hypothetical protein
VARTVGSAHERAYAFAELAVATAESGDTGRGRALLAEAQAAFDARTVANPANALRALAKAAALAGEHARADAFALAMHSRGERASALVELAASDLREREGAVDPSLREECTLRATRRAAEALALEVWTKIYWVFQDGSGPLSFAVKLDPRCADVLLELGSGATGAEA